MPKKTPPFDKYPTWTTARFWSFIRSALRKAWTRWPPKFEAMQQARRTVTGQRHRYEYQCAACEQWYKAKEVEVDHKVSAGSLNSYEDIAGFTERLFVSADELDILCKPCHKEKTLEERALKNGTAN